MPLITFCGIPCSGKSKRARALHTALSAEIPDKRVLLLNNEELGFERNVAYKDGHAEKSTRGEFKAHVERHLSPDTIVIVDSLNYIKGFRYELYCRARAHRTPSCVVYCDTPVSAAREWNLQRTTDSFSPDIFDGLVARFETPSKSSRWDQPLYTIRSDGETPLEGITSHIRGISTKKPNLATIPSPIAETSFVYELDRITQDIVTRVLEDQGARPAGAWVSFASTGKKIQLKRKYSLAELRRLRRQFLKITQTHRPQVDEIGDMFVEYLTTNL